MKVPTRSEQRLAALLAEAAEPMDPVVSPGAALTQKARRRATARRSGIVAGVLAAVLAVGGSAVWLDGAVRDAGTVVPAGDALPDQEAGVVGEAEKAVPSRIEGELDAALISLLGSADGHTSLTTGGYVYELEWLWIPHLYKSSWVLPKDIEDVQVVPVEEWPAAMAQCIAAEGYPARVNSDMPWVDPDARDTDLAWHARGCALEIQPEWAYADFTVEDWGEVYDHLETRWSACEKQSGSPVYWLIDRDEFIHLASRGPIPRRISNLDERLTGQECSQIPDHLRAGTPSR